MATTLKQTESMPASYPTYPPSPAILSAAAAALDPAMIWQRIESHICWRWTPRSVTWVAEGPGEWAPPLKPAIIHTKKIWEGGAWQTVALEASPLGGFVLPGRGLYRFTATAGCNAPEPPAAVLEAFRRLAEYSAAKAGRQGATREQVTAGSVNVSVSRSASWIAEALQNSGAADLLRPYRRA